MGRVSWGLARSQEIADGGRGEGIDAERRRDKPNRQCADHKDAELLLDRHFKVVVIGRRMGIIMRFAQARLEYR